MTRKATVNQKSTYPSEAITVFEERSNDYEKYYSEGYSPSMHQKFNKLLRKLNITRTDLTFISLILAIGLYFLVKEPMLIGVLGTASVTFFGLWQITRAIPILEKYVGCKIRFWHVVAAIIAVTALLNTFETPAHAFFLSGIERFMKEVAEQAGGTTGTAIPADTITLIFNVIRGVFLLLVATAALFAYNQAQQGNDWRPIVVQIGLAFGIVIAIDVITKLFIPTTT